MESEIGSPVEQKQNKIATIVLFGILSVVFAEVFSGSAPLWFLDAWGLLVVLPLYWGHGLLLLNLAMRFERTSVTQLYLWGIFYGLYESWMTKVIWAGYMGQEPQFGVILGFAWGEFMVIALFWHAVFSFILPIAVFQILGSIGDSPKGSFPCKNRSGKILYCVIILIGSVFIASGFVFDIVATSIAAIGNTAIVLIVTYLTRRSNPKGFTLETLKLGRKGAVIVSGYVGFLYIFLWFFIFPERIAGPITILLTILFYLLIAILLRVSPPRNDAITPLPIRTDLGMTFEYKHIAYGFVLICVLAPLWCIAVDLIGVLGVFLYLGMLIAGPILFIVATIRVFASRLNRNNKGDQETIDTSLV
ncbi:MAG: hypothetical protein P1Q69_12515 [Candidatus Thorarchaeota archaeon]|nr:hypothetical protein [Candidatus Thorarchaeota archaeon]